MNELENIDNINIDDLYNKIVDRIEKAKRNVALKVNEEMTILYWNIGKDITENVLNHERAEYGKAVIKKLSQRLTVEYGRGYSSANLFRMLKVYEYYPDFQKFSTLSRKLSWSHFVELLQVKDSLKRDFYTTMCENEFWGVRTLRERIGSALFERTAISKMPEQTIVNDLKLLNEENKMTTNLFFRDPYILDFLDLKDTYSEKDLENAIISELEKFILEMGNDFAFLARQKRITIDGEDYYIDLLFYHRKMKRLVVIELKLDKFRPEYKGQVELYLKWLDKYEKAEGEESPIAIILCATKSDMMAQLLELDNSGIHVAQYLTEYVPKEILEQKLKEEELMELYQQIEFPLAFVLGDMEKNGVYLNQNTLKEMGEEIKENVSKLEKEIYQLAGCEFLITSPKELGNILFEKLGLPHGKKTARGYSTAADVLEKLKDVHPIIPKILEYRMITKLYTTYIEGLLNTVKEDGKIHTIYTQNLTRTGRLSSVEPNLQNIPARTEYGRLIRKAFIPSQNCVIVGGDYSQIELRILAHMSNVQALIDAFNDGLDIHTKTASDIFHVAKEDVTSHMRRVAKAVNFGIIYGISSFGLSENLNISVKDAKHFIDHYLETYPGVQEYMDKQIKQAYQDGYVRTLFNRKRIITELQNSNYMIRHQGERMALNTPIQGTSADIIKKAMVDIDKELKKRNLKTKMILQVHDELLFDCNKDELEEVKSIIKDKMEHVLTLKVPLKVDIAYGNTWYEAK